MRTFYHYWIGWFLINLYATHNPYNIVFTGNAMTRKMPISQLQSRCAGHCQYCRSYYIISRINPKLDRAILGSCLRSIWALGLMVGQSVHEPVKICFELFPWTLPCVPIIVNSLYFWGILKRYWLIYWIVVALIYQALEGVAVRIRGHLESFLWEFWGAFSYPIEKNMIWSSYAFFIVLWLLVRYYCSLIEQLWLCKIMVHNLQVPLYYFLT